MASPPTPASPSPEPASDGAGDPHAADLALARRLAAGDRSAADELFQRELESLHDFVYWRAGRRRERAEDLVQEALLTALDRIDSFDGRSSLHTWLRGIALNKLREERRKRRPVPLEDLLLDADPEIDALLADISREPLPEAAVEARETRELVGAAMSSLPPNYREALVARYVDGKTVPAFAAEQGHNVKAAESTLHRARQALSRVLGLLATRRGGEL